MGIPAEPVKGPFTDRSGTLTTGGAVQSLMDALPTRRYLFIQNLDGAEDLWINFDGASAVRSQPSMRLDPGAVFIVEGPYCPIGEITIIGRVTAQAFTAKESI